MLETKHTLRILPVHVINPQANKERSVHVAEELESLITTLGGEIVDRLIQKLDKPDHNTFIGRGKVEELLVKVKEHEVDVVVLNTMAKPSQVHNLKLAVEKVNPQIEVWDRIDLILHIFEKHADTTEAKLQIELARMKYMGPRIYGMGFVLSRQGGGIGTIGKGETNTELMQRHWRDQVKKVKDQLEKITQAREQQLERRKRVGFKTVSLVGYTNAGKSSLYNLLSKKDKLVENALFATLDSSVGKLYLPGFSHEVLVTDTIGFIRNLPPHLIDAFKSTLLESIHADVILHVVDVSDPEVDTKIKVVNKILYELGRNPDDVIFVFNKTDAATEEQKHYVFTRFAHQDPLFISVKGEEGIEQLLERIAERLLEDKRI